MILGWALVLHGSVLLGATIAGACGYVSRKLWKDAIGVMLTIGIAAVVEMIFGLNLIF
jgi:hypothetical protein